MIAYRPADAQSAFEDARQAQQDARSLVVRAFAAARRGRTDEVESCLASLRHCDPVKAQQVADELRGLAEAVKNHPAGSARSA